ncbi:uncharacterized protein LOC125447602 [Stegostoma tigrinum]|uniref:uncharacterized protein LOC125447602 n=1 Tax=Stegostoma tigrinum TaxID=3053191 RepID=UPI00202B4536|nr:uncharacterized protein LOC125447602 [Stegostoma tigrinum]
MNKRKKSFSVATKDGTIPVVKKVKMKCLQPGEEEDADTIETECKTVTEEQETEDISIKPAEEEQLATSNNNVEHTEHRTSMILQEVEEKGCRTNSSQNGEHFLFPLSQNSVGKYVPVFAKPKSRLSRCNSVKHDVENTGKQSLNSSKVDGNSSPQHMDLGSSEFYLPAAKHQMQISQQPSEQIACSTTSNHSNPEESGKETDDDSVKERSNGDVFPSDMQIRTQFVSHETKEQACHSDQKNLKISVENNKKNKLDHHPAEMDVLYSTPIPIANSTPYESLPTLSDSKTQNLGTCLSDEPLDHCLYQEKTDVVPVSHDKLTLFQDVKKECTIASSKEVTENEEGCVLVSETLKNSGYKGKSDNLPVVCEMLTGSEVNRQELAVQMNLIASTPAKNDLKDTICLQSTEDFCSNSLHQSFATNVLNQMDFTFNSQTDVIDRQKYVKEELQEPPSSAARLSITVGNNVQQNIDACQKDDDMNGPCSSGTEVTISTILHKDSDAHQVKPQLQSSQCFLEDKTVEIEHEVLPGRQDKMDIESQKITQNICKSFHSHEVNIEQCSSVNCSNPGEETKQLNQEKLSNNHSHCLIMTALTAQSHAGLEKQCVGSRQSKFSEAALLNIVQGYCQTDLLSANKPVVASESTGALKMNNVNSCGSEPQPGLKGNVTGSQELEVTEKAIPVTSLSPSYATVHSIKTESVVATEGRDHEVLFDSNCDGKATKDNKELGIKLPLVITDELKSSIFLSMDNKDLQTENNSQKTSDTKIKGDLDRQIEHKADIKRTKEDVSVSLPGTSMEDRIGRHQQDDKTKKEIEGSKCERSVSPGIECGGINISSIQESAVERSAQLSVSHIAEKELTNEAGTLDETDFPVEKLDMDLDCDLVSGDVNILPKTGPNLTAIPVAFSLQQPPEDFTKKHGYLPMMFPPSHNEMPGSCSDGNDVDTETGCYDKLKKCQGINGNNESKGYRLPVVDVRSCGMEQGSKRTVRTPLSADQVTKTKQNGFPCAKSKVLTKLSPHKVQPDVEHYKLQLIQPTLENRAVMDLSQLNAPQEDNANISELEDLHLSESDWQAFSPSAEDDATHVVCGLINELSKINRVIMITHRELESMRRYKNRRVRPVGRHLHISKGTTNVTYSMKRKDP